MKRRTWQGHGGPVEKVGVSFNTTIIRKAPKPVHTYGSPGWELKREEAERQHAEAAAQAAEQAARKAADDAAMNDTTPDEPDEKPAGSKGSKKKK